MITVGLDFGTHQTKICIERREGAELEYKFWKFSDENRRKQYAIPSIIGVKSNGRLVYGYISDKSDVEKKIRYFKQSAFCSSKGLGMKRDDAIFYSALFLAYIIFDLEEKYGDQFTIQMGAPADSASLPQAKEIATTIIASAYNLVENVFKNDKKKFLNTKLENLREVTRIIPYSGSVKREYGLLVFPESYACLKPLVAQNKITRGMSLMVDIGGGTTDISFFTVDKGLPQVYDFFSFDKGLNYLIGVDGVLTEDQRTSHVRTDEQIIESRKRNFSSEINRLCAELLDRLEWQYKRQTILSRQRLTDALKNRPLVYSGGGSTFQSLCMAHGQFRDTRIITVNEWNRRAVKDASDIEEKNLCQILSTAYGLSISVKDDEVERRPFEEIFKDLRTIMEREKKQEETEFIRFGSAIFPGFDYQDYDAYK